MAGTEHPDTKAQRPQSAEARQINLREFYSILFTHKWSIAAIFIILIAAISWGISLREERYVASLKLYVNRGLIQQVSLDYVSRLEWEEEINSIAEIGRSQGVLSLAAREWDRQRGWPDPPIARVNMIAAGLATMVEVLPVQETDIINILVHESDPDTALAIAEVYGAAFQTEHNRVNRHSYGREFFTKAISDVESRIRNALDAKADLQTNSEIYNWSYQQVAFSETEEMLRRDLNSKRIALRVLENQVRMEQKVFEEGYDFVLTPELRSDELLKILESQLAKLRLELAELESRYTGDHRLVRAKRSELESAQEQRHEHIVNLVRIHEKQLAQSYEEERILEDIIAQMNARSNGLPDQVARINYYDEYVHNQWTLYSELLAKYNDSLARDEQTVVEQQLVALGPANIGGMEGHVPKFVFVFVIPAFALLLAIAFAFMIEATNSSFQTVAQLEAFSGLPVLASFRKL
jgi:uncharacterized protein involved in exopolysaccharide biosynthesis